ncbi:MAG TPA: hypothetical protein VMU14_19875 [Acidimicrobiales bacterium]|nr:hypothetical protein [Acidimicrobiales bacterium]
MAVLGMGAAVLFTGLVLLSMRGRPFAGLIQPGLAGPATPLVQRDFPGLRLPPGAGNDGQLFYALARDPLHPTQAGRSLDRSRYRLQRPLYPLLAWALHPWGGGNGLVAALLTVNTLAAAIAVASLAWWASRNGRSPVWGVTALALPGAYMAMRISCADLLAAGLALLAAALLYEDRPRWAIVAAVASVLTKESTLIFMFGIALSAIVAGRSRRCALVFVAVPTAVAGALWAVLLVTFPHAGHQYAEVGTPLRGLAQSASYWRASGDWRPALTVAGSGALAFLALARAPRSWFAAVVGGYLALAAMQTMATLAFWTSAPRTLYPLGVCALAALLDGPAGWTGRSPGAPEASRDAVDRIENGSATGAKAARGSAQHALQ